VAFADGNIPTYLMQEFPPTAVADIRAKYEEAARSAIERFEAAVKGSLLSETVLRLDDYINLPARR